MNRYQNMKKFLWRKELFFSFPMPSVNGTRTCLNYNTFSLHAREKIPNAQGRETLEDVTWRAVWCPFLSPIQTRLHKYLLGIRDGWRGVGPALRLD